MKEVHSLVTKEGIDSSIASCCHLLVVEENNTEEDDWEVAIEGVVGLICSDTIHINKENNIYQGLILSLCILLYLSHNLNSKVNYL